MNDLLRRAELAPGTTETGGVEERPSPMKDGKHILDTFDECVDMADAALAKKLQRIREPLRKFVDYTADPKDDQTDALALLDAAPFADKDLRFWVDVLRDNVQRADNIVWDVENH